MEFDGGIVDTKNIFPSQILCLLTTVKLRDYLQILGQHILYSKRIFIFSQENSAVVQVMVR